MSLMAAEREVVLASADPLLRERLRSSLTSMRWNVREASGGAEALAYIDEKAPEAVVIDGWLPDLEIGAFATEVQHLYPQTDLFRCDGTVEGRPNRSPRRHELLQAIREATRTTSVRAPEWPVPAVATSGGGSLPSQLSTEKISSRAVAVDSTTHAMRGSLGASKKNTERAVSAEIPGLVGQSDAMMELARLIRLVAPHSARVLIEGQTGTGKELVAKALHALSGRVKKPFVVLNCAAIPEALLEAELFGHTRGAFTGAVQSRVGRIEAAHGGTLFLDEIGEMPLSLQAKLLRFLENGELQRVGDNEAVRVDVRVIAATHQHLEKRAEEGSFRLDLFHRLAVFPIYVPSLGERLQDLPALAEHFLAQYAEEIPRKRLHATAIQKLLSHPWPGNVRELGNVLQRAMILVGDQPEIGAAQIVLRHSAPR